MFASVLIVVVGVLEKWARHRAVDEADDNVAQWGFGAIGYLAVRDEPTQVKFIAAGAEQVLRSIRVHSDASEVVKIYADWALEKLGLQS